MTVADLPDLKAIMQDAATMVAYEGPFDDTEVQQWLDKAIEQYKAHGHWLWAVVERRSSQTIGQCGITWQQVNDQLVLEVGYLFNRAFWHQGFATEAARACLDWAFGQLGAEEVFAIVRDTNVASMNVAIRLGMTIRTRFVKHFRGIDMPHFAFAITRQNASQWCGRGLGADLKH
ncbi:MAG: GNAT family N-acetyltransferase [Micrococcales bacterium]|nr:GNAT family N-acetyltransferase [Micrococcales bacterium]